MYINLCIVTCTQRQRQRPAAITHDCITARACRRRADATFTRDTQTASGTSTSICIRAGVRCMCAYIQMYSTPPDDGQTLPVHTDTSTVCTYTVCTHTYAFRCRARHLTTGTRSLGVSSTPPHEAARPQHKRSRKTPRGSRYQRRLVTLQRQDPICVGVEAVRLTPLLSNVRPKRPAYMS